MRLLALTFATATFLAFAFAQTPRGLAQGSDKGVASQPLQLDGGPSLGSDNRGQPSGRSEGTEQSAGVGSEKSRIGTGKGSETKIHGRSQTHIGLNSQLRHRVAIHRHGRRFVAFNEPRHRFVIHRRGRRFVAFNEPDSM